MLKNELVKMPFLKGGTVRKDAGSPSGSACQVIQRRTEGCGALILALSPLGAGLLSLHETS